MKKLIILLVIGLFSFEAQAQITYEKGYFINNSDEKVNCFIKNIDWNNNPEKFSFKLSENGEAQKESILNTKEFTIDNVLKYVRVNIDVDMSSNEYNLLTKYKQPEFKKEQMFLKVLVEGDANLYLFEDKKLKLFFYSTNEISTEQLIYKRYKKTQTIIGTNNQYKQQLWNTLKCDGITNAEVGKVEFKRFELVDFFVRYNECIGSDFTQFDKEEKKKFNFGFQLGLDYSSLTTNHPNTNSRGVYFDHDFGYRVGLSVEYVFPFNKNKWALVILPSYRVYNSEIATKKVQVNYKSIEVPIGIKHYFYINEKSRIFLTAALTLDFSFDSAIHFDGGSDIDIETGVSLGIGVLNKKNNLALGLGYLHNNKYSIELMYFTSRNVLLNYLYWESDYEALSMKIGYRFN